MLSIFTDNGHYFFLIKVSRCLKCAHRIISESHFSVFGSRWRSTRRNIFRLHSKCNETFVAFILHLCNFLFRLLWAIFTSLTFSNLCFNHLRICYCNYRLIEFRRWTQISIIIFIFWLVQILIIIFIWLLLIRDANTFTLNIIRFC